MTDNAVDNTSHIANVDLSTQAGSATGVTILDKAIDQISSHKRNLVRYKTDCSTTLTTSQRHQCLLQLLRVVLWMLTLQLKLQNCQSSKSCHRLRLQCWHKPTSQSSQYWLFYSKKNKKTEKGANGALFYGLIILI